MSTDTLAAQVTGPVLTPGDAGYEEETATWNIAMTGRPAVAVGATSVADVQAAVRYAAAQNLPVAVTATGHGQARPADGALLINLRRMNEIAIDAAAGTATVGAAVEVQNLVDAAAAHGLAPLAGSSPNVGVVGYTLGGGLSSTLGRTYGWAADHVRAAEIVTADGELRHIDADTEPDLFWAIRGGKGNFGVVTSLTVGLVPVTRMYAGGIFFDGADARPVIDAFRRLVADAPDALTSSVALFRFPPLPFVPEPLRGKLTVHLRFTYLGSAEEGAALLADARAAGTPLIDAVGEMPYTGFAAIHADPVDPIPAYEQGALLRDFPAEAADALLEAAGPGVETPVLAFEIRQLGGALSRAPEVPNAVGHRDAKFSVFAAAAGAPGMEKELREPLFGPVRALAPWATGGRQINFFSGYETEAADVATGYEPAAWERLRTIKTAVDPGNLFRVNHNIPPLG
ncbi:FAD/FMN-containing dehydrogenase [Catenuloplanes nepalensis]|uniref:FAD/FMN-containing dehydrogenase n=1 Tax=Catenuloplanes nepalensis TaxID=587533 RepID=A0ABT9MPV5_9ACTN|nr:FAD-binding oxidoreductase [Catenuloplanes nepalensis]MDP9793464.1 FAD/FMN-containing dehydrogenase [Catenuloplanes nepalensis]